MRVRTIRKIDWHGGMVLFRKNRLVQGIAAAPKKYLPKAFRTIGNFKPREKNFEHKKMFRGMAENSITKPFGDNFAPPPPIYKRLDSLKRMVQELKIFPSSYDMYSWIGKF